jgi:hypothetical protein
MVRKFLLLLTFSFCIFWVKAQTFTLTGRLQDADTKASIQGATITLRSLSDSSRQSTFSDSSGRFRFTGLSRDSFRLSISSVSFETLSRIVHIDSGDVSMNIAMSKTSKQLAEVTIVTTAPPATQKGDTVQFNASQFKVNPDASAEDLTRKIPGITIENGQVKANGENVQKVTIDGRELFGDDATAALRNLPAEVIDKIQVFDRLSDQAQFTGFDDGNTTKGINIITKANMRNGQFGRIYAGYGTDERYQAGGNATFFKNNRRLSLVGNFNNINQQNFSQQDLLGVTSNAQRGGGGNRGGGSRGGGGGNRPQGGGGQGGNSGGFGNNGNFLVGQQNGINKTNALGINFSDIWWKKLTVTGSYFFNNTNNITNETGNTQYFSSDRDRMTDTTASTADNTNHRVNLRFEYKIDSSNQLIVTPSLSFQSNNSDRRVAQLIHFTDASDLQSQYTLNTTASDRTGNNLNNNILFRHSFPKRGRTFSINLNTSSNKRISETYVDAFRDNLYTSGGSSDSLSQRFTDQKSDGMQVSANLAYTEPLSATSQLQFNYNPSFSKNSADQQTFAINPADNKYTLPLVNFSNQFENKTKAQNAGLSYRIGDRDKQISFGANFQHTNLTSDRLTPTPLQVDKSFNNVLPNAMIRYKFSPRTSIRVFYRANVNQPSVTQLQDVVDLVNAPTYSVGNPYLEQQYMNILSTQYTFTNTQKGLLLVGNLFLQSAKNYIATATFTSRRDTIVNGQKLDTGFRLTKPINLDGYRSLRSFLTFATPIKTIKTNLNLNGGFTYTQTPGYTNYVQIETRNYIYSLGTVLSSNISQYVDFNISYTANFNQVRNSAASAKTTSNDDYFQHVASVQLNLLSKTGWFYQTDLNNQYYSGLLNGNSNYTLWNMGVGKKFLKDRKGELKLSAFDVLKQNQSISRTINDDGSISDVRNEVLRQYFMLTFTYNLRNFGTPARSFGGQQQRRIERER